MASKDEASHDIREQLVVANHILVNHGSLDAFGHVSARVAPGADAFVLSRNLAPGSVTKDDLVIHDLDGNAPGGHRLYLERFIHAEIYRSRPDVMAVVHGHSGSVIPFGLSGLPLRPVIHMAGFLSPHGTPVYDIRDFAGESTDLLIRSAQLGRTLASRLGDGCVCLMRGHGSVVVGNSVPEVVFRAIYAEANAAIQLRSHGLGELRYLTPGEAAAASHAVAGQIGRAWDVWCEEA